MKNELLKQFINIVAGFLMLAHGFFLFEKNQPVIALVLFAIGFFLLILSGLLKLIEKKIRKADALFFIIEAAALAYSASVYQTEGNTTMLIISAVLATVYLIYGIKLLLKKKKRRRRRHHRSTSRSNNIEL